MLPAQAKPSCTVMGPTCRNRNFLNLFPISGAARAPKSLLGRLNTRRKNISAIFSLGNKKYLPRPEHSLSRILTATPPLHWTRNKGLASTGPRRHKGGAASDDLDEEAVVSALGRWVHRLVDMARPDGFQLTLFSPRSARRDCTAGWPWLDFAGSCGFASNVTPQDADVIDIHPLCLLDSRAPSSREPMSSDLCQMALL